jgi:hypothetical protein
MAKEQWHNWGRTAITVLTLAFVCGLSYSNITQNTDDIDIIEGDIKVVKDDVHKLELRDKDLVSMSEKSLLMWTRVDRTLGSIQKAQASQALMQTRNSVKLETLTKD